MKSRLPHELLPYHVLRLEPAKTRSQAYRKLSPGPVDKMILEKSNRVLVIPAAMGWSDVGSWSALAELRSMDTSKNCAEAKKYVFLDAKGNLVLAPGKQIALIGVDNLVVVSEGDRLLICRKDQDQRVREIPSAL